MAETLQLGGNIELTGFSDIDPATLVVVKKIVGNHAKRYTDIVDGFDKLHLTLKHIHQQQDSTKFELHCLVAGSGAKYASEVTEINLFFALDKVLKKIENEISK